MTNEEYYQVLPNYIKELEDSFERSKELGEGVIGENLLLIDLCYVSLLDRSVKLTEGFKLMLQTRNLTCAGALLRLEMDNSLRLFASYIAQDENEYANCVMKGDRIDKLKDKNGKQMKDGYLKRQMKQFDKMFCNVYDQSSGYIHFSEKSFYQSISAGKEYDISAQITKEPPEKINPILIECADAFIHYLNLFYKLMYSAVDAKQRFDKEYEEKNKC